MRLGFLFGEVANGLRRNTAMFVSVVLVTMVSVFFMGGGLLAQQQASLSKGYWYDRVQVTIFLCTPNATDVAACVGGAATQEQRDQIESDLESLSPLVEDYFYESNGEAYDRFREQFRNSPALDTIPQEAIPESFRVQLSDPSKYDVIAGAFQGTPGVDDVVDQRDLVQRLAAFLNVVTFGAVSLALAMLICALLLIGTTIRLTAWSRRRETNIMRMVGASAFTLYVPFIIETVLATLLGSLLALALLYGVVEYGITGYLSDLLAGQSGLVSLIGTSELFFLAPFLVGGAVLLAVITSWFALRRYVRV